MASQPNPLPAPQPVDETSERRLTREEGWDLIESMFGSAKEAYAEYGGSEAWIAAERAAWGE